MTRSPKFVGLRSAWMSLLAMALALGGLSAVFDSKSASAASAQFGWSTVANVGQVAPGGTAMFNSFSQPSVNDAGVVTFRARTKGSAQVRGVYIQGNGPNTTSVGLVGDAVPDPNNSGGTFNEFPSFPRIDATSSNVVTRGQSTPVMTYTLPDGTDTKVGTSGVYATIGGHLTTGASLLGAIPTYSYFSVPGAPAGTRFDQFPGSPAIDGSTIVFKGNYTVGTSGLTGDYYRDLSGTNQQSVQLIADSSTLIPGQATGGTTTFGSTAPPSAAAGKMVFTGWDNEDAPTVGGVFLAPLSPSPTLTALATIGDQVPGQSAGTTFTNFGEGVSFDGRFAAFWGSWGSETRSITLYCPTDGNTDLLAYCNQTYPNGYSTSVPVNQGMFVYDTTTSTLNTVTTSGTRFSSFQYWVFSGSPPGTGSGDATLEPPRWRVSSFAAVSGLTGGDYQVAFKGTTVGGATGIYVGQGPSAQERIIAAVQTSDVGTAVDSASPAGTSVSSVGIERDGFRGRHLAITVSMLNSDASVSWAGEYVTTVPSNLAVEDQVITFPTVTGAYPGANAALTAMSNSGLPVTYSIDGASGAGVCTLLGTTVYYEKLGSCIIDVNAAGDAAYNAAQAQQTIDVAKRPQVITFPTVAPAYVGGNFNLVASSDSGLPVSFTIDSSTTAVCSLIGATVHYHQVGTCIVNVNQAGDTTYAAAAPVSQSISVTLQPQVISVGTLPAAYVGSQWTLNATTTSGLTLAYSLDSSSGAGVCSLSGSTVTFVQLGTCVVAINQAGDALFAPASTVKVTMVVVNRPPPPPAALAQVITPVAPPTTTTVFSSYTLAATTDSGLPVTYSIDSATTAGTCSLVGSTVNFTNVGTCVIDINQPGNSTYAAAPQVQKQITIGAVAPSVKVALNIPSAAFGQVTRATASVSLTSGVVAGVVQFSVDGKALGAAQPVVNGVATSPALVDASGRPLVPGAHRIGAVFTPSDNVKFMAVSATMSQNVRKASSKLSLVVHPKTITATVLTVAPGVSLASGTVTFKVSGKVVGRAVLRNRVATLRLVLHKGQSRFVTAVYGGNANLSGSSSSRAIVKSN